MALIKLLHDEIAPLVGVRLTTEEHLSRDGLSKRLRETLLLLLEGYSEKQVAGELMLAVRTVHELCCDALSALSCFGSRRTFGLLYPAEAGSTTTGADRFRNELAPTSTCSGGRDRRSKISVTRTTDANNWSSRASPGVTALSV